MKTLYKTVALILITPLVIGVSAFCVALMLMIGVVGFIYGDPMEKGPEGPSN